MHAVIENKFLLSTISTIKRLPAVEMRYNRGNCEKNPFILTLETPLSAYDLYLIDFPSEIRDEIMKSPDFVVSELYFDDIKLKNYPCYN